MGAASIYIGVASLFSFFPLVFKACLFFLFGVIFGLVVESLVTLRKWAQFNGASETWINTESLSDSGSLSETEFSWFPN